MVWSSVIFLLRWSFGWPTRFPSIVVVVLVTEITATAKENLNFGTAACQRKLFWFVIKIKDIIFQFSQLSQQIRIIPCLPLQVDHNIIISWVKEGEQASHFALLLRLLGRQVAGNKLSSVQHILDYHSAWSIYVLHRMINLHVGEETIYLDSSLVTSRPRRRKNGRVSSFTAESYYVGDGQADRPACEEVNGWRWMAFSITVATRRRIKLSKAMREATCRRGKTFDRWSRCGGRDGAGRVYNTGEVRKWTILVEFWQGTSSRYPLFERIAGTKQLFSIFTLPQLLLLLGLPRGVLLLGLCHEWD